jgi:Cft2 family RNA processing exonuclease
MKPRRSTRAFVYRDGIGLAGTHITCDGPGFANDLVFLSHAYALPPRGSSLLAGRRAGRRQIVATEKTLLLLGSAGDKLKARTLPATFGRPFNLGQHRIEIVSTGFAPGAAGLLCESGGHRLYYVGAFCPESFAGGLDPAGVRSAHAVCIDASAAVPGLRLPPRRQTLDELGAFVQDTLRAGAIPVLLGAASTALPWVAITLAQAGVGLRAHARVASAFARLRLAHDAIPTVGRYAGKLAEREALLWPSDAAETPADRGDRPFRRALIAVHAADPATWRSVHAERGFAFTPLASHEELLAFVEATTAREVALFHGSAEPTAALLRDRGFDAYALGPPRQMTLPGA